MNPVLQGILSKLTSKYGDDIARSTIGHYGDDIAKRGAKSFLSRELSGEASNVPKLLSYHSIPEDKLMNAISKTDGYLVNPSLQTVNPALNVGGDFGEIALLANKDLVNSYKPGVNSFNRDVYSPRVPNVTDDGLIEGTKQFASADNLSKYMNKSAIKGSESTLNSVNSGSLAGRKAKKFKNIRDMVENQSNLGEYGEVHNELNKYADDLRDLISNMSEYAGEPGSFHKFSNAEADLFDMARGKRAFYDYPESVMNQYNMLMKRTKDLPTDYFETKLTRPVKLNEFSGAVIPEAMDNPELLSALERNNIPILGRYDHRAYINDMNQNGSLKEVLENLAKGDRLKTPYLLGSTGLAGAGLYGLLSGSDQDQQIY